MHDLPASPRRSIVATQPKPLKKVGAPKAKGAVRAKSGCYTCRIRRKKCDEQPNDDGRCQTCIRLRLQCLGFGQKRPEWLKENNNVTVFREKIKDFLAAQGMIKGHSGAGARSNEQEGMLILVSEPGRSDTSSPPTPTLSASSSNDDHRYSGMPTSNVRDGHYPALSMPPQPSYNSHGRYLAPPATGHQFNRSWLAPQYLQELSPDSPLDLRSGGQIPSASNELMFPAYPSTTSTIMSSSNSLVLPPTSWSNNQSYPVSSYSYAPQPQPQPQHPQSTFVAPGLSQAYYQDWSFDEELQETEVLSSPETYIPDSLPTGMFPALPPQRNGLVKHYLDHVLMRQYLLADKSISAFIIRTIQQSSTACDAVCLLASLHQQSLSQGRTLDASLTLRDVSANDAYMRICTTLMQRRHMYTEEEALTGLLVVSAFLFRGGRGAWQQFLAVASDWVEGFLQQGGDTAELLLRCTESQRFIIKTTFWFDILASTTRLQQPRFLLYYRRLWGRHTAYIEDPVTSAHLSMLSVMGCENATALAIAETADLASWKEGRMHAGTLSTPTLVERGKAIEQEYLRPYDSPVQAALYDGALPFAEDEITLRRRLTSAIFRATAKVYLHSVVSGDFPNCPEIREGVGEALACLRSMPPTGSLASSVLRSVMFSICLCGCLTDDWDARRVILQRLEDEQRASAVGNGAEARRVMELVWERRRTGAPSTPANWRHAMQELDAESLLLV